MVVCPGWSAWFRLRCSKPPCHYQQQKKHGCQYRIINNCYGCYGTESHAVTEQTPTIIDLYGCYVCYGTLQ